MGDPHLHFCLWLWAFFAGPSKKGLTLNAFGKRPQELA